MRVLATILLILLPAFALATPWHLDPSRTSIKVKVGYAGTSGVTVDFRSIGGAIDFDEKHPETARATIKVASQNVETGLGLIDNLVRSRDYLDAKGHPHITFRLDRIEPTSGRTANIHGSITLRGVTRPITFAANVFSFGPRNNAQGVFEAGFDMTGQIDRRDFGSTAGQPQVSTVLPITIRLVMTSKPV